MGKYCFCVIHNKEDISEWSECEELYIVAYKEIAMVAKDVGMDEVMPTGEELQKHEKTNEKIMENATLIPMSFGNISRNEKEIINFLKKNYETLAELLMKFENRVEVGLKVYWTAEGFESEVEDLEVRIMKLEIERENRLNNLKLAEVGRLIEQKVEDARKRYKEKIFNKLSGFSCDSRLNSALTPGMVLNSSFLIEKDKKKNFDEVFNRIYDEHKKGLIFKYTGPWPPYNFIDGQFSI